LANTWEKVAECEVATQFKAVGVCFKESKSWDEDDGDSNAKPFSAGDSWRSFSTSCTLQRLRDLVRTGEKHSELDMDSSEKIPDDESAVKIMTNDKEKR
jgi:hypothetical protein